MQLTIFVAIILTLKNQQSTKRQIIGSWWLTISVLLCYDIDSIIFWFFKIFWISSILWFVAILMSNIVYQLNDFYLLIYLILNLLYLIINKVILFWFKKLSHGIHFFLKGELLCGIRKLFVTTQFIQNSVLRSDFILSTYAYSRIL